MMLNPSSAGLWSKIKGKVQNARHGRPPGYSANDPTFNPNQPPPPYSPGRPRWPASGGGNARLARMGIGRPRGSRWRSIFRG